MIQEVAPSLIEVTSGVVKQEDLVVAGLTLSLFVAGHCIALRGDFAVLGGFLHREELVQDDEFPDKDLHWR